MRLRLLALPRKRTRTGWYLPARDSKPHLAYFCIIHACMCIIWRLTNLLAASAGLKRRASKFTKFVWPNDLSPPIVPHSCSLYARAHSATFSCQFHIYFYFTVTSLIWFALFQLDFSCTNSEYCVANGVCPRNVLLYLFMQFGCLQSSQSCLFRELEQLNNVNGLEDRSDCEC